MTVAGPILFARYAFGPNRLGYCGPDDAAELFEQATIGREDGALRALAQGFEGAYPYLELIARANGLADPLDARVVDAYWLGSDLLDRVGVGSLGRSLEARFRGRLTGPDWRWLATTTDAGARPVHAFHVMDVFPKLGLLRGGKVDDVIRTIDACRVRWGRVRERDGDWLVVDAVPLELVDGKLALGAARPERIQAWRDGVGFLPDVVTGDVVSVHWDWACDRLTPGQLRRLQSWTRRELAVANRTI
jgi:hypothetical protein